MRKDVLGLLEMYVGELECVYLDNENEQPIALEEAKKYVYDNFISDKAPIEGHTKAIRFAGKENLLNEIEKLILKSKQIKLKKEGENYGRK